jgi:DNA-binding sugar fermentation-stimulating protein
MKNEEIVLQNKLIACHCIIEKQLKLIERETLIGNTRKRCDIHLKTKVVNNLFVEVKQLCKLETYIQYIKSINYRLNRRG